MLGVAMLLLGAASLMIPGNAAPTGKGFGITNASSVGASGAQPLPTTAAVINSGVYTTRPWLTQKHVYSSTGDPSNGTLVEVQSAVLSNVANGAASQDCSDPGDSPPAPPGTWCDSVADVSDGTGTVHVEIDQVYKYLGIAPADWPIAGASLNIIGYTFMDGEGGTSWEIHPVTAWSLSNSSTFTLAVSAGSGGTMSPAPGSYAEPAGSIVSVTANPSSGFTFYGFTLDGVVSTANPISVPMNSNHILNASFSSSPYSPPVRQSPGGGFVWQIARLLSGTSGLLVFGIFAGFILTLTVLKIRARSLLSGARATKRLTQGITGRERPDSAG